MTINVALKCPQGIVMGADSLVTLFGQDPTRPVALMPRYRKLFPLGALKAGAMLNGDVALSNGRMVEDVIAEYVEGLDATKPYALKTLGRALATFIDDAVGGGRRPELEIIVCGFSTARGSPRNGEMFTIQWDDDDAVQVSQQHEADTTFGYYAGGQPAAIHRFLAGLDTKAAQALLDGADSRFEDFRAYAVREIEKAGQAVPPILKDLQPPLMSDIPPWAGVSTYRLAGDAPPPGLSTLLGAIVSASQSAQRPLFNHFSLPMAVDMVWHLLLMAWAESNFMADLPRVGSQLTVATITRREGFCHVSSSEPGLGLSV